VREFCLYGETSGETDEFGLPVRFDWAEEYRGKALVVYGHVPSREPRFLNNTVCIDTGCVFGSSLSAYRYPEGEIVSVAAAREYYAPEKPLDHDGVSVSSGSMVKPETIRVKSSAPSFPEAGNLPVIEDVLGRLNVETRLCHDIIISEESGAAALKIMSRFSADSRWLIYLPPTMSPCKTSSLPKFLEHPIEAFEYYRKAGLGCLVCEEKHMGSRAVIVLCRDAKTVAERFGVEDGSEGIVYTRTGRHFFDPSDVAENAGTEGAILERLRNVLDRTGFWERFATGWVCLDTELMPWSAKARSLLLEQYGPTGRAGRDGLAAGIAALRETLAVQGPVKGAAAEGLSELPPAKKPEGGPPAGMDVAAVLERFEQRRECLDRYTDAYRRYCWPVSSIEDYRIAPFHILATEGKVWNDENHLYHLETIRQYMTGVDPLFVATNHIAVDLNDNQSAVAATDWWLRLTGSGGEGMVVKPLDFIARRGTEPLQPAVKCRGREYLRIIYGPEYTLPENLERLRRRSLTKKRRLALAEFALGQEALERFVRKEPFHRLHECVFAVLALENEAVDPRL
jgi:protein phosphatase